MALNKLLTRVTTIRELKTLFNEILFNTTNKVSKISKLSVLNGISYAIAKIAQKGIKDIAIIESQIFPEFATGEYLDNAARLWVSEERLEELGSSTFIRINAASGTVYSPGSFKFISDSGIEFDIVEELIVSGLGFDYVKVRSVNQGSQTNVDAFTINTINPTPAGHISCTNEYRSIGGRDYESDELFRERILSSRSIFSRDTISYITEILKTFDQDIIKVSNLGLDDDYLIKLAVLKSNGAEFTNVELIDLREKLLPYLSLSDTVSSFGQGIKLVNPNWLYIGGATGIDFRADILTNYDIDEIRKQIQISLTKFLDFRFFNKSKILWDDLLEIIKNIEGVNFVPVEYFNPKVNQVVSETQSPRIKNFRMRDISGNILFDSYGIISPVFYQNE